MKLSLQFPVTLLADCLTYQPGEKLRYFQAGLLPRDWRLISMRVMRLPAYCHLLQRRLLDLCLKRLFFLCAVFYRSVHGIWQSAHLVIALSEYCLNQFFLSVYQLKLPDHHHNFVMRHALHVL